VLKIHYGQHSIVVNTQTPNRQLWYSCTKSGPQRFDYVKNDSN
jgi:frataxin-like iron-binding protein CyaY